jgi:ParB family transcriptional regulator, chromosome partitioning protein
MAESGQSGRKRGLGRGLGALMGGGQPIQARSTAAGRVSIDAIHTNPEQPRREFDSTQLASLADSIRQHGVLQPLLVVPRENGYRLIAGERRLRAARIAGLTEVPVTLHEEPGAQASLALSLIENIQRHDLNALEEAQAYRRLLEEFEMSQEETARQVGRTRAHVSNTLRLLAVAPAVQGALLSAAITAGHARALAGLSPGAQEDVLRRILRDELNVRQTEQLVQVAAQHEVKPRKPRRRAEQDPETRELEARFRDALQTKVSLQRKRKGGRLVIEFYSNEELDGLYRRIVEHHLTDPD